MPKSKLSYFRSRLDAAQIANGMNAAQRNARRLAGDARLLFDLARYPTAAALAILSIEESGKVRILRGLALERNGERRRQLWKEFRLHRSKNVAWIIPDLFVTGARTLESLRLAADPSAEHTALLDQVKQLALYTDCLGTGHWSEPLDVINEDMTCSLVSTADLLAKGRTVTRRDIELWIEQMGPTYRESLECQKISLSNWYATMRENGLSQHDSKSVDGFLWGT